MIELEKLRGKIDRIDRDILKLLNERGKLALEIGKKKKDNNLEFHSPERERSLLQRLVKLNEGPLPDKALTAIYREILSACLSLEEIINVSYLGPIASFTHLATVKHFGSSFHYLSENTIKNIFESVSKCKATYGVVPIENSNEGVVNYTLDMFVDYKLYINSEIMLNISQNLLSITGKMDDIKKVYSHPHALAQCRNFIETHFDEIPVIETMSTATAAEFASKEKDAAAIASEIAANIYNLQFVQRKIEDNSDNYTRFLVIARRFPHRSGYDKTSVLFSIKDKVGALNSVLHHFKKHGINLTKIQSRPSKIRAWDYIFFIDLEGHIEDDAVKAALAEVKEYCLFFKVLGSYPFATI